MIKDVRLSLSLLPRRDKRLLALLVVFQLALALLDLLAIGGLGIVASLAASSATGQASTFLPGVTAAIRGRSGSDVVLLLAMAAGVTLVLKSFLSFWGTRRAFRFLANRQAMVASRLANELLSRPLIEVQRRSSQEHAYALTSGVHAMTVGILGQAVVIASEIGLVIVLLSGLLFMDPAVTLFAGIFFAGVAGVLHVLLAKWAVRIGNQESMASTKNTAVIQESLRGYREVTVSGRRGVYTERFHAMVWQLARIQSNRMMIQTIGKYVFEVALILGAGVLVVTQLATNTLADAAAVIVVFLVAASRIMPALLRVQGAALSLKISAGTAQFSIDLIEELNDSVSSEPIAVSTLSEMIEASESGYQGFLGTVSVKNVSLVYPDADRPALKNVSIAVPPGSSCALVGATGAGKSTLADVILGVLFASEGSVSLDGLPPEECIRHWPGAIAYIPQEVAIVNGSVRENVAMGLPQELVQDDRVFEALERAHLADFLSAYRDGLDTLVGENGVKLSGGQRQRLGIARALYTRPRLLVMDEATSALDAQTEASITATMLEMSGNVTRIFIAHRLATIRDCDQVIYLDDGRAVATGSFEEVRELVPGFERQAQLLGL